MSSSTTNDRAAWLEGPSAKCSSPPQVTHPWRLVLRGAAGVGKGTQAELPHKSLGACRLSTGDVFRAAKNQAACALSPAMADALSFMRKGALVPDSTVWDVVRERGLCLRCRGGFILDGFPRTLSQATALRGLMEHEKVPLNAVVSYELPLPEIVERLSGRRTCEKCKAIYHIAQQPPQAEGVCDRCGSRLYQREDDRSESITVRMEAYERNTAPRTVSALKARLAGKTAEVKRVGQSF